MENHSKETWKVFLNSQTFAPRDFLGDTPQVAMGELDGFSHHGVR